MAAAASSCLTKEQKPYPLLLLVAGSLTTRQSEISPKAEKAFLNWSVSISGERSPTKM